MRCRKWLPMSSWNKYRSGMGGNNNYNEHNINTPNRDSLFLNFLSDNDMSSFTHLHICTGPKYTFTTMQKTSDHIVMYNYDVDLVKSVKVIYGDMLMVSDHLPVLTTIKTSIMLTVLPSKNINIAWHKVSDSNIQSYQHTLATLLEYVWSTNVDMYFDIVNSIVKTQMIAYLKQHLTSTRNHTGHRKWSAPMMPKGMRVVYG